MAWRTPNGCILNEGDEVVWIDDKTGNYNWFFRGTVVECLPVNDDDDGEIRINWESSDGPLERFDRNGKKVARVWYYPMWVEKIDAINILDRIVGEL